MLIQKIKNIFRPRPAKKKSAFISATAEPEKIETGKTTYLFRNSAKKVEETAANTTASDWWIN